MDNQNNQIYKVEAMVEADETKPQLNYKMEVSCAFSSYTFDFVIPNSVKSQTVSCQDLQKALSKITICDKPNSIGDRASLEADMSSWLTVPTSGESTLANPGLMTQCGTTQNQLTNQLWSVDIADVEGGYRDLPSKSLYSLAMEFNSVMKVTKFYVLENIDGLYCPTGFNTKNVDRTIYMELTSMRDSILDQLEGPPRPTHV